MMQSSSLTASRRATGKLFTARTHFINHSCSAALKRKHLRADGAKAICRTAIERPRGLLEQKVRSVRGGRQNPNPPLSQPSSLLFFLTLSQVQNNQIPCSPRPEQTGADGRWIGAGKIGQSFRAAARQKNCQVHHVKAQRREFGPSGVS